MLAPLITECDPDRRLKECCVDSGQLTRAVRHGWLAILLFVVLGLAASVIYLRTAPVTYTARADVYVSTVGGLNVSELSAGSNFAQQQARNLSLITTRERVLAARREAAPALRVRPSSSATR